MKGRAPVGKILQFCGGLEIAAEEAALQNPAALAHTEHTGTIDCSRFPLCACRDLLDTRFKIQEGCGH